MSNPRLDGGRVPLGAALAQFNRKERFLLAEWALGAPDFPLGDGFRDTLRRECGIDVPDRAFVATDYHLDWVYAALCLAYGRASVGEPSPSPAPPSGFAKGERALTASQEDIDLLVAFTDDVGRDHMVFIEAKAYSGWTNKQLRHKARRLGAIFGDRGDTWPATPTLVLTGPKLPTGIKKEGWPAWTQRTGFIAMPKPLVDKYKVVRCTADGAVTSSGGYWKIAPSKWSS